MAAKLFVEVEDGLTAAEVKQAVEGVLNAVGIGAPGAKDGFNDRCIGTQGVVVECVDALGDVADRLEKGIVTNRVLSIDHGASLPIRLMPFIPKSGAAARKWRSLE